MTKGWTDDNIRERCCFGSVTGGGSCRCTAGHPTLEKELGAPDGMLPKTNRGVGNN